MKPNTILRTLLISLVLLGALSSCGRGDDDGTEPQLPPFMTDDVQLTAGSRTFNLSLFDNEAGRAFRALLPLTISMEDVNGNEKFFRLPQNLPADAANPRNIHTGDLMLYGSNGLVLFYKSFSTSYSYTRIGRVDNPSGLETALGSGVVEITFAEVAHSIRATLTYNTSGANTGTAPIAVTRERGCGAVAKGERHSDTHRS